jgi:hypothetical protein
VFDVALVDVSGPDTIQAHYFDLRVAWRQLQRTGPPIGLSCDLFIRSLAYQLKFA